MENNKSILSKREFVVKFHITAKHFKLDMMVDYQYACNIYLEYLFYGEYF
jgi:hypothetical protein